MNSWFRFFGQGHLGHDVLSLAGVDLIFIIVAQTMLWIGPAVLITQGCFHYCQERIRIKAFSSPHSTSEETGGAQGGGRGHSLDS